MTVAEASRAQRVFAAAAMILVAIYVVVDVFLQFLPPHYSVITDAESDLVVGPFGWVMRANFLGRGVMSVCIVVAVVLSLRSGRLTRTGTQTRTGTGTGTRTQTRTGTQTRTATRTHSRQGWMVTAGCALIVVAGACSAALVFFATDVNARGQFGMSQHTDIGRTHVVFATIGFIAVLLGMILLTATLHLGRAAVAFVAIAGAGLLSLAVCLLAAPQLIGVAERLCLLGILGWAFTTARLCLGTRVL